MVKGKKKDDVLYRVVKFEIHPIPEEIAELLRVSENLREVWNEAREERKDMFDTHLASLYEARAKTKNNAALGVVNQEIKVAYVEHRITLFDQINALTEKRAGRPAFAAVPRNWQEETLDTLNGAFTSFMSLRKKGDMDAFPPKSRDDGYFSEIPGRYGFKVNENNIILSLGVHRPRLTYPIPGYQQGKLADAVRIKKFTLYRRPRELAKPGRFWVSVAYEISRPATIPVEHDKRAYVAVGSSFLGVVSPTGNEVIRLWRPDKHWQRKILAVESRMKRVKKGSRKWHGLAEARRNMFRLSAEQQKLNRREVVQRLLRTHGSHFVVTDLVIRSKEGKLADAEKPERGGRLGLHWSAQNTGNIAALVAWLEEKTKERGGSVLRHRLVISESPEERGEFNKLFLARALRDSFLSTISVPDTAR
jgi:transposase